MDKVHQRKISNVSAGSWYMEKEEMHLPTLERAVK
jgi:hypothetical protein